MLGHKSACMIAGVLGCLKSGHAFVPVDTEMPLTRLADILSQLGETLVVVTEDMPDALACALPESDVLDALSLIHIYALGHHGVGELLEARDVGAHDVVALVAVLLGSVVGCMVDVLHDALQLSLIHI